MAPKFFPCKAAALATLALTLGSGAAWAGGGTHWSVVIGSPGLVVGAGSAAPVYMLPPPAVVYVVPQPVYVLPPRPARRIGISRPAYPHGDYQRVPPPHSRPVYPQGGYRHVPRPQYHHTQHAPPAWAHQPARVDIQR